MVVGRLVVHRKTKRGGYGRFRVTRSRYDRPRLFSSQKTKKGHVSNSFPVFRYLAQRRECPIRFRQRRAPHAEARPPCRMRHSGATPRQHEPLLCPIPENALPPSDDRTHGFYRNTGLIGGGLDQTGTQEESRHKRICKGFPRGKRQPACYSYSTVPRKVMFQTLSDS